MKQRNSSILCASMALCVSPETIECWIQNKDRIHELESIISSKNNEIENLNNKIKNLKLNILKQLD